MQTTNPAIKSRLHLSLYQSSFFFFFFLKLVRSLVVSWLWQKAEAEFMVL